MIILKVFFLCPMAFISNNVLSDMGDSIALLQVAMKSCFLKVTHAT
jgi:hypothetical protein